MAQIGAVFVFCSSCKILYFASSVHPKNATELFDFVSFGNLSCENVTPHDVEGENSITQTQRRWKNRRNMGFFY